MSRLGDKDDDDRDIHFIRCIRPNHDLQRGKIVSELVEKQLYSCGIVDAIRITANGFPIRYVLYLYSGHYPFHSVNYIILFAVYHPPGW